MQTHIVAKFIKNITVTDPDSKSEVEVSIYKMETGALVGIDSSYVAQEVDVVQSPYDEDLRLDLR